MKRSSQALQWQSQQEQRQEQLQRQQRQKRGQSQQQLTKMFQRCAPVTLTRSERDPPDGNAFVAPFGVDAAGAAPAPVASAAVFASGIWRGAVKGVTTGIFLCLLVEPLEELPLSRGRTICTSFWSVPSVCWIDNTLNCNVAEGREAGALAAEEEEGTAAEFADSTTGLALTPLWL
jgi:hypothetical protein